MDGREALPSVVELEKQLGAPAWMPEFIRRWHAYLKQATISGVPVVPQFDPATVCDVSWRTLNNKNDTMSFTTMDIAGPVCKTGTFPIAYVGGFTDNRATFTNTDGSVVGTPLAAFTFAVWNPKTEQTELRTFGYSQHMDPTHAILSSLSHEGVFFSPNYNYELYEKGGDIGFLMNWFQMLQMKNGIQIYDDISINASIARDGIYADGLDQTILFGGRGAVAINSSP